MRAAVGGSAGQPAAAAAPKPASAPASVDAAPAGLAVAYSVPRLLAFSAHTSRSILVEAVYAATALSGAQQAGRITRTGTLRVAGGGAAYDAAPADRLVVQLGDQRHEFVLEDAQGDAQAPTAAQWLLRPHALRYRHSLAGVGEVAFDLRFDGAAFTVAIRGTGTLAGERVEVAVDITGETGGVRDLDGHDLKTSYRMTGTLRGEGYEVEVQEQHALQSTAAQSLGDLPSMRGAASRVDTTIASTLHSGGHLFAFVGVRAQSDTKEKGGRMVNQDGQVAGVVTCDGAPFGTCAIVQGVPVVQTAKAVLPLAPR